jgi:hypothetical protein
MAFDVLFNVFILGTILRCLPDILCSASPGAKRKNYEVKHRFTIVWYSYHDGECRKASEPNNDPQSNTTCSTTRLNDLGYMWQDSSNNYGASSSQNSYYSQPPAPDSPLQFYAPTASSDSSAFYPGSRPSLDGNVGPQGSISQQGVAPVYGGNIQSVGGWWTAFGTGGFEGEPPLLEGRKLHYYSYTHQPNFLELGINFFHIRAKSLTVLNPLRGVDARIMDDADMAGPIIFLFCFGICLLLVSVILV